MRILACLRDLELLKVLMNKIQYDPNTVLIAVSVFPSDIDLIDVLDIDVCLLDYESFSNVYYMNHLSQYEVHILCLLKESQRAFVKTITAKTMAFMTAPYTADEVLKRLMNIKEGVSQRAAISDYNAYVARYIQQLGIPVHLKGYHFIKSGATTIYKHGGEIMSMVQLYKEIARIHKTTSSRVEKAIRDAIEYAYRKTKDRLCANGCKPTNSQLIYHVYEHVTIEITEVRDTKIGV
ncbi:hypothetical protein D5266_02960 [bacterium c-19]|nr:hypothetical protein [bacterium c-19]